MNFLQALYCNQYQELKAKGKEAVARKQGTVLASLAVLLNAFVLISLLVMIFPDLGDFFGDLIRDIFGRNGGKMVGKIIAALAFGLTYFGVKFTLGTEQSYQKTIARFEAMAEPEQNAFSKRGQNYFFVSLGLIVVPLGFLFFA